MDKDYVNFENGCVELINLFNITKSDIDNLKYDPAPSLWDVMKWLEEVHHILVVVDVQNIVFYRRSIEFL